MEEDKVENNIETLDNNAFVKKKWIDKKSNKFVVVGIVFCCAILFAVYLYFGLPISLNGCPMYKALGHGCPAYGGTRAARALTRFNIMAAMQYNLLFCLICVYFGLVSARCVYKISKYNQFVQVKTSHAVCIFVAMLAFTILRNLPFWTWY